MPPQGTKYHSPLARWLNEVGMTSRELMRRLGYQSIGGFNHLLKGTRTPTLAMMYEIERMTEGAVPIEAWMSVPSVREMLEGMRAKQPEAYRPKSQPEESQNAAPEREEES